MVPRSPTVHLLLLSHHHPSNIWIQLSQLLTSPVSSPTVLPQCPSQLCVQCVSQLLIPTVRAWREPFSSASFTYLSNPVLGWKHSRCSLLNEKCICVGERPCWKKWRLFRLEIQERQDFSVFLWLAKFN